MLSVLDTLREAVFLWARNFWYLVLLTLLIGVAMAFVRSWAYLSGPVHQHLNTYDQVRVVGGNIGWLVLDDAYNAAVLGLLIRHSCQKPAMVAAWESARNFTWTLFRLNWLIIIIALVPVLIIGLVFKVLGLGRIGLVFAISFYLIFIKYALANPLVVEEGLMAIPALKRSWKMTKGHFRYVTGCYLVLGLADWTLHRWIQFPTYAAVDLMAIFTQLGVLLIESVWIVLSWIMYLRIKEADVVTLSKAVSN